MAFEYGRRSTVEYNLLCTEVCTDSPDSGPAADDEVGRRYSRCRDSRTEDVADAQTANKSDDYREPACIR